MSNVEHSVQVNQKVLQDENHSWQKYMADYNFGLDIKKKQADYIIDNENKKRDFDYFKKEKDYEAGIARDKSIFDAKLDFEKGLSGLSGSGSGGGAMAGLNKLTKGANELTGDGLTAYDIFQAKKSELMDDVTGNYFDETVLQAATHDSKYNYPEATSALMTVMQGFNNYGNPNNKNFTQAPKEYQQAYNQAVGFLKLIDGNVKVINSTADIPNTIYKGVGNYTGNVLKWKAANDKISAGALAFNQYATLRKKEDAKMKQAIAQGYGTEKYWTVDESGTPRPKTELTGFWNDLVLPGKYEFSEADKNSFYKAITPDYERFQAKTAERSSTLDFAADPKTFNFNAIGDLIGKSYKVTGIGGDKGMQSTGKADDDFSKFINKYRNAGSQLGNYFAPNFHITKLQNGDLKVEVPFNVTAEGKIPLANVEEDVSGQTATFYVDKANAVELWKAMGKTSFLGKDYNYNTYGAQFALPRKTTNPILSVRYLDDAGVRGWLVWYNC
jgi:hypothetical protein